MTRRLILIFMLVLILPASVFGAATRQNFVNRKYERPPRYDPRLKYLQTRKAGACLGGPGACTMGPNTDPSYTRYKNSYQEKEAERRRRLRPWL